jgi:hypothetical protein
MASVKCLFREGRFLSLEEESHVTKVGRKNSGCSGVDDRLVRSCVSRGEGWGEWGL